MADTKTTPKIGVNTGALRTPDLTQRPVSFAPVTANPSGLAKFADKVVPLLAREKAPTGDGFDAAGVVADLAKETEDRLDVLKGQPGAITVNTPRSLRNSARIQFLGMVSKAKLTGAEYNQALTTFKDTFNDMFHDSRVEIKEGVAGRPLVVVDGDYQLGAFDQELYTLNVINSISEFGRKADAENISRMLTGIDTVGNPLPPEERVKQQRQAYNRMNSYMKLQNRFESLEKDLAYAKNSRGLTEEEQNHILDLTAEEQSSTFRSNLGTVFSSFFQDNLQDIISGDPAQAMSRLRHEMYRVADAPAYSTYRSEVNQLKFHTDIVDRMLPIYESMINASNQLAGKKYTKSTQDTLISIYSNQYLLETLGPKGIGLLQNAENLGNMAAAAQAITSFANTPGGEEHAAINYGNALFNGIKYQSLAGQLNIFSSETDPQALTAGVTNLTSYIGEMTNDLSDPDAQLYAGQVYKNLLDIKGNKGVETFLKSDEIDPKLQKSLINTLNDLEMRLRQYNISQDQIEEWYGKTFSIDTDLYNLAP